uniref:RxLR effector candidate protein n=1 Tax=Hyaloperonospora arabidopsidis (strain Emoy2) TaxID=559515 RepID=M4B238_HYAAE
MNLSLEWFIDWFWWLTPGTTANHNGLVSIILLSWHNRKLTVHRCNNTMRRFNIYGT